MADTGITPAQRDARARADTADTRAGKIRCWQVGTSGDTDRDMAAYFGLPLDSSWEAIRGAALSLALGDVEALAAAVRSLTSPEPAGEIRDEDYA
jgi:hypothetical protein